MIAAADVIEPRSRDRDLPLSFAEIMMWQRAQRCEPLRAHNIFAASLLAGPLNRAALETSLCELVQRHEILRTGFVVKDDRLVRVITTDSPALTVVDLRDFAGGSNEREARRLVLQEVQTGFDLAVPMFRAKLVELGGDRHVLVLTMHHAISDAWSLEIVTRELKMLYASVTRGGPLPPPLRIQYADYAIWKRGQLTRERYQELITQWRDRLKVFPGPLCLTDDTPVPALYDTCALATFELPRPLADSLAILSRRHRVTTAVTFLTAFTAALYRCTGQADMSVLVPSSHRRQLDLEQLVGMFVDIVPVRIDCSGNPTFAECLHRVRSACEILYSNDTLPLMVLLRGLDPDLRHLRGALGQLVFNFTSLQNPSVQLPGMVATEWSLETQPFNTSAVTLNVRTRPASTRGKLGYRPDLFPTARAQELAERIQRLLTQVTVNPSKRLDAY
jgi:NRPS condensation-like uncharacterized protein